MTLHPPRYQRASKITGAIQGVLWSVLASVIAARMQAWSMMFLRSVQAALFTHRAGPESHRYRPKGL